MVTRITQTFSALQTPAFIPFFTVGDPDLETTAALVLEAAEHGADLIELGIPFSDPVADGPTIQASYQRALAHGFKVPHLFELVLRLRARGLGVPLLAMISETLVFRRGLERFLAEARQAGLDGLIVPDLPIGYEGETVERAAASGLNLVFLCAPATPPERRERLAKKATGFIYYLSVAGITGVRAALPPDLGSNLRDLKQRTNLPVCVGFGIGTPEQAAAVAQVAEGAIVGSALVRRVAELAALGLGAGLAQQVGREVGAYAQAVHASRRG